MNRVDIIAKVIRENTSATGQTNADYLARVIDAAIRDIDDQNFCDGYGMGFKEGYDTGYEAGLQDEA